MYLKKKKTLRGGFQIVVNIDLLFLYLNKQQQTLKNNTLTHPENEMKISNINTHSYTNSNMDV